MQQLQNINLNTKTKIMRSFEENKRTKTCEKIKKVPKLDLKDVEKNYNKNK